MRKRIAAFLIALALPVLAFAQAAPAALLIYVDDPAAVEIIGADGSSREAYIGDEVLPGETVKTAASGAELKLDPNGSVIKIARNTAFKVEALAGTAGGGDSNDFALLGGKIRTVAARASGTNKYRIRTPTAVCGVRGTDFSMIVKAGVQDAVFVKHGLVAFSKDAGAQVMVGAGQFADAMGASFAAAAFSAEQFANSFGDEMEFTVADPAGVDQGAPEGAPEGEAPAEGADGADEGTAQAEGTPTDKPVAPMLDTSESKIMAWLQDMLGFEIGSVVIDGETYSKAVIQPTFSIGKLRMGLYLPVIYTSNLFDPDTWYKPAGNNEWSFGSEYWASDPTRAAMDAASDLALKIRFVEWGTPLVDPFYLKVGNLNDMTIGHGVIMRNFANDSDFPSVRRIGVNTGFDFGSTGFEAVVNDIVNPEIFGGRFYVRPVPDFKLALGVSAIADINPAAELSDAVRQEIGDPMLFGLGSDLDLPIVSSQLLSIRAFADVAAVMPYTRADITDYIDSGLPLGTTVNSGAQISTIYDSSLGSGFDALRNYGFVSGLMGNMLMVDWRLEYRHYRGAFRPTFFDATYERNRGTYAMEFAKMLTGETETINEATVNGIYGEAGFSLLKDRLSFTAGYMMPWSSDSSVDWVEVSQDDYMLATLVIKKGVIPIIDIAGRITYERTGFAYALLSDAANVGLFDENTILQGEVTYPISSNLDFAVILSTATARNDDGTVIYVDGSDTRPKVEPTVTFETRVHF